MNDIANPEVKVNKSLLAMVKKHRIPTVVVALALLGTGIGMWASLPQRIATPVVPKHPLVQFPPPVLSYPVLPNTLNQEIAKIAPPGQSMTPSYKPWPSMTPTEAKRVFYSSIYGVGVTSDGYTPVSNKTYWSAPICAPKDLKVAFSPLDVTYSIVANANINVAIKNVSSHPCDIPYEVQIGSWLGCEWTRPSPCSKSVFASFRGCKVQGPSYFKVPAALSPSGLCSIGANGDIQAWNLPEVMIYSTSGKLVGLWAVVGADYAADTDIYVGPPDGPLGMFLKPQQMSFYSPLKYLTAQTKDIFFRKLPGTYIAQAVIPLGYIPPSIGGNGNPPSHLPGVNWNVEPSPPFKVYLYYTKPITFTVK